MPSSSSLGTGRHGDELNGGACSSQADQSLGPDSNSSVDLYQANLQNDRWRGRV